MDLSPIINELAEKYKLHKGCIHQIVYSELSFIRKVISEGEHKTLILPKLGKFTVKPHRLKLLYATREQQRKFREEQAAKNSGGMDKLDVPRSTSGDTSQTKG